MRLNRVSAQTRDCAAFAVLGGALAALYLVPLPLALLAVALLVATACLRPIAAVWAIIAAAPLATRPVHFGAAQLGPVEIIALGALAALAIRWLAGVRRPADLSLADIALPGAAAGRFARLWPATAPLVLLVLGSVIATALAGEQREALRELRTVILEPLVVYLLVIRQEGRASRHATVADYLGGLVDVLVLVGVAIAVVALAQYAFTGDVITAEGVRRVRGLYGSPNNLGLFLGRIVPLAVCVAVGDRSRRWHAVALIPVVAALVLTFSVGAWLGIAAALLFVAAHHGRRLVLIVGSAIAGAAALTTVLFPVERLLSHLSLSGGTSGLRLALWWSALTMARDHPVFGVGPDNFLPHYRDVYRLDEAWSEPNLSHPHNLLLDLWLRAGLLGLAAGLWLLARFFRVGLDLLGRVADPGRRALVLGLLASMIDFVAHGLVDNSFFLIDLAIVFWLSYAMLELLRREHYNTGSVS